MGAEKIQSLHREFTSRTREDSYRFFQQREADRRRRKEADEDFGKEMSDLADIVVGAVSSEQAQKLRLQIDRYDTATINALYDNEQELIRAQAALDEIVGSAYVLPDGRKIFKSEDGERVYDENGIELDGSIVDPNSIEDWRPTWERFDFANAEVDRLRTQRTGLIEYQDKLDNARERLEAGDMTQDEYDRLREDLVEDMPGGVRRQIPELASEDLEALQQAPAADIDLGITDDMVATTAAPRVPGG